MEVLVLFAPLLAFASQQSSPTSFCNEQLQRLSLFIEESISSELPIYHFLSPRFVKRYAATDEASVVAEAIQERLKVSEVLREQPKTFWRSFLNLLSLFGPPDFENKGRKFHTRTMEGQIEAYTVIFLDQTQRIIIDIEDLRLIDPGSRCAIEDKMPAPYLSSLLIRVVMGVVRGLSEIQSSSKLPKSVKIVLQTENQTLINSLKKLGFRVIGRFNPSPLESSKMLDIYSMALTLTFTPSQGVCLEWVE